MCLMEMQKQKELLTVKCNFPISGKLHQINGWIGPPVRAAFLMMSLLTCMNSIIHHYTE